MTDSYFELCNLLEEYGCSDPASIEKREAEDCHMSILQLRDRLLILGTILYEDLDRNIYVASIKTGALGMNFAVIAVQLQGERILAVGYAKEGAVKQNSLDKAWAAILNRTEKGPKKKAGKAKRIVLTVVLLAALGVAGVAVGTCPGIMEATQAYNIAVEEYNQKAEKYNQAVKKVSLDNITGFPEKIDGLKTEEATMLSSAKELFKGNSKDKICSDTDTVAEATEQIEKATVSIRQITAPKGEWVADRLKDIRSIKGTELVTKETDANQMLGKPGGYSDCVYFASNKVTQSKVPGETIAEKGTDAGGAIEVYPTVEDARKRCEYLSGFDGTVLYSGSYAIVGTTVIRTSYLLENEEQIALTASIAMKLTEVR